MWIESIRVLFLDGRLDIKIFVLFSIIIMFPHLYFFISFVFCLSFFLSFFLWVFFSCFCPFIHPFIQSIGFVARAPCSPSHNICSLWMKIVIYEAGIPIYSPHFVLCAIFFSSVMVFQKEKGDKTFVPHRVIWIQTLKHTYIILHSKVSTRRLHRAWDSLS
jgi:hypothetical protein